VGLLKNNPPPPFSSYLSEKDLLIWQRLSEKLEFSVRVGPCSRRESTYVRGPFQRAVPLTFLSSFITFSFIHLSPLTPSLRKCKKFLMFPLHPDPKSSLLLSHFGLFQNLGQGPPISPYAVPHSFLTKKELVLSHTPPQLYGFFLFPP